MHRAPAPHRVVETLTARDANTPPLQAALGQLQAHARRPGAPPGRLGTHDQIHQRRLGGRIHPTRDPATQPQRSFPSANVNLTAISANAVRRRSTSAPGRLGPHVPLLVPPARTRPRQRIERALPRHLAQLRDRRPVHPRPIDRLAHHGLPTHELHPDLALLLRRQEPLPPHTRLDTQQNSPTLGQEPSHAG